MRRFIKINYIVLLIILNGCADKISSINNSINQNKYLGNYPCQEYVTKKYLELKKAGFKDDDIKFVITSYNNKAHVVINVKGRIMDNIYDNVYPATKSLSSGMHPRTWMQYKNK